ncbi:MAG: LacI family DNA-binding transcriptional regulator [Candidatus Nanopelagicales bacterium]|nr:LacI family DNA-binding transcriptional regulator [Candidatus Nanopelagicales bacterium]MDD2819119.1 LacI family DNA-binding transcriptional regulator [Candidatus Nanopelagicales bacterium]
MSVNANVEFSTRSRPTMKEVAALSGTSLKTVSRVMNEEAGVSPELIKKVKQAAQSLNYQPNFTASSLRRSDGKTNTIGLLLEDVANPFSSALQRAIEEVARERGVAVLAGSVDEDQARERELAAAFISRRVDGLIVVPAGHDQSYLQIEKQTGTPMVFVDRPPSLLDADSVLSANREGAKHGVQHLIDNGHERIAYLGDLETITTAADRLAGYRDALERAGIEYDPSIVKQNLRASFEAERFTNELMASDYPPSAIFASQNLISIGVMQALHQAGLQNTIALVGFDDIPMVDLIAPGLTAIIQDVSGLGKAAAEMLFDRIDGEQHASQHKVLDVALVIRGSGEIQGPVRRS